MYGDLETDKPNYVARMFSAIAPRYDLMNRVMTLGRDETWRLLVARELGLTLRDAQTPSSCVVLDVAAGTGDIARHVALLYPRSRVVALDFCMAMMLAGRGKFDRDEMADLQAGLRPLRERVDFVCGDAMALPYADDTFDGVATGFALRNVTDIPHALREMRRVLKPGSRLVCLEVSRPRWRLISSVYWWYFFKVVPLLGGLISGQREAYAYLPQSAQAFLSVEDLAETMRSAGFHQVRFRRLMLGAVAEHVGEK